MNSIPTLTHIVRHFGVSFAPGVGNIHFWVANANVDLIEKRWDYFLVKMGLAEALHLICDDVGITHGFAKVYLFTPLFMIKSVINPPLAIADQADAELREQLALTAMDANNYLRSYGLYYAISQFRAWVGMPILLGRQPAIFLGIGKFSRLLVMNFDPAVSSVVAPLGTDKAYCRSLLMSHGLKVAPGAIATTALEAKARANELGYPVTLKISQGGGNSEGVILGITDEKTCTDAANELLVGGQLLVIERMVEGVELRLHFIRGQLFRILKSEAYLVEGDGATHLEDLLKQQYPDYFKAMMSNKHHQRRLIFQLYCMGVRQISDISKIVPAPGVNVRVSAATGGKNMD